MDLVGFEIRRLKCSQIVIYSLIVLDVLLGVATQRLLHLANIRQFLNKKMQNSQIL